jgi:6-phosphogluconolactonase
MRYTPFALLLLFACQTKKAPETAKLSFYIGTYTQKEGHVDGKGDGIYKMTFDPATLELSVTDTIKGMTNPSFLALSKDQLSLYVVNEIGPGTDAIGLFEAYSINATDFGKKMFSNSTQGYAPCHIALSPRGTLAVVSNYVGGMVSVFSLTAQTDSGLQAIRLPGLKKSSPRQEDSHPHSAIFSADGKMVYVADLGTDRIMAFLVDENAGKLLPAARLYFELPDGSGPRHMTLSRDGSTLYVLCELSNQVAVLDISSPGDIQLVQNISTLPTGFQSPNTGADIHLSQDGQMLYTSNRGHNSIAIFKVKPDGTLESKGHAGTEGKTPRNFHLSHDGRWMLVANQDSGNIVLFDMKKEEMPVFVKSIQVNTPVCIVEAH